MARINSSSGVDEAHPVSARRAGAFALRQTTKKPTAETVGLFFDGGDAGT